jgi:hypothetical protein
MRLPLRKLYVLSVFCLPAHFCEVWLIIYKNCCCCACDGGESSADAVCELSTEFCWNDLYWNDLTACAKIRWASVGYTNTIWDSGAIPAEAESDWADLSASQVFDLGYLGYDATSWDLSNDGTTSGVPNVGRWAGLATAALIGSIASLLTNLS